MNMPYNLFIDDKVFEINSDTNKIIKDPKKYYPNMTFVECDNAPK